MTKLERHIARAEYVYLHDMSNEKRWPKYLLNNPTEHEGFKEYHDNLTGAYKDAFKYILEQDTASDILHKLAVGKVFSLDLNTVEEEDLRELKCKYAEENFEKLFGKVT